MILGAGIHGTRITGIIHHFHAITQLIGIHIITMAGGILILIMADTHLPFINIEQMMITKSGIILVEEMEVEIAI
jgi:hypothetical protein